MFGSIVSLLDISEPPRKDRLKLNDKHHQHPLMECLRLSRMPSLVDTLTVGEQPRLLLLPVDPGLVSHVAARISENDLRTQILTLIGFSGQFISDALTALGSEVMSGDAMYYRTWFREFLPTPHSGIRVRILTVFPVKGLADGEVQVLKSKVLDAQGPDAAA